MTLHQTVKILGSRLLWKISRGTFSKRCFRIRYIIQTSRKPCKLQIYIKYSDANIKTFILLILIIDAIMLITLTVCSIRRMPFFNCVSICFRFFLYFSYSFWWLFKYLPFSRDKKSFYSADATLKTQNGFIPLYFFTAFYYVYSKYSWVKVISKMNLNNKSFSKHCQYSTYYIIKFDLDI